METSNTAFFLLPSCGNLANLNNGKAMAPETSAYIDTMLTLGGFPASQLLLEDRKVGENPIAHKVLQMNPEIVPFLVCQYSNLHQTFW